MKLQTIIERTDEIRANLDRLGNVSTWKGEIDDETGELRLYMPPQFRYSDGYIQLDEMETATSDDLSLLRFLGDAPHAQRFLLAVIEGLRKELIRVRSELTQVCSAKGEVQP